MKIETFAEELHAAGEAYLESVHDSALLAFDVMTDGLSEQYRAQARKIVQFYEHESTPQFWQRLALIPDPENPTQSVATGLLDQWAQYSLALGKTDTTTTPPANAAALSAPEQPAGY